MGAHLIDGEFQSDKYPTVPRGLVPLSVNDRMAQDLLWEYAQRRRSVDAEFSDDLESALLAVGYQPPSKTEAIAAQVGADAGKAVLDAADAMARGGRRLWDRVQKGVQDRLGPGGGNDKNGPTPA